MPITGTRFEPFIGLASSINSLSKGKPRSAAKLDALMATMTRARSHGA